MKIYTKTGDKGFTSLLGGTRVRKNHLRIECYGTIDELNSYIGLILANIADLYYKDILNKIQNCLFTMGSMLASDPEKPAVKIPNLKNSDIEILEIGIDKMNEALPVLKHFILPGGNTIISFCHITRCICRKAERYIVHLSEESYVNENIIIYLNRLSDFIFVLARKMGLEQNIKENEWRADC